MSFGQLGELRWIGAAKQVLLILLDCEAPESSFTAGKIPVSRAPAIF
jgi:hypothetical protein